MYVCSNLINNQFNSFVKFLIPVPSLLPALLVHGYREVDGRRYYGVSKEKATAREEYDERTTNNENVGLVESRLGCVCGGGGWQGWCIYGINVLKQHTCSHTAQHILVCNTHNACNTPHSLVCHACTDDT